MIKFAVRKILLWSFIVSCCCFRPTTQQFGFNNFGFRGPIPFNRGNDRQTPSAIRVNNWLPPGQELIFSSGGTNTPPATNPTSAPVVVNNAPTVATLAPFIAAPTTPTPAFIQCFQRCPTTSEYNPICASNRELYGNEQKFNCARSCGADIQIVRRGSCQGLLPMTRG